MRSSCLFYCFLLLVGLAVPVAAQTVGDGQRTTVTVGVTGRPDQASLEIGFRRGYFAKQGLDLQFVQAGYGASDYMSALARNQMQVTAGAPNAAMFNAFNRGIDIRIVADWSHLGDANDTTQGFIVRSPLIDSGAVKTPADLKGRALNPGPKGGSNDLFFDRVLTMGHLTPADIRITNIGFTDAIPALANGTIDGALLFEPLVYQAKHQGIGKVLVTGAALAPGEEVAVVFYSPDFAKNREIATTFMVAYLQGMRDYYDAFFLNKGKDEAIALLVQNLSLKDPAIWAGAGPANINLNGQVNIDDIKLQAKFFQKEGLLTGPIPDVDKYIDMSFANDAVLRIGKR